MNNYKPSVMAQYMKTQLGEENMKADDIKSYVPFMISQADCDWILKPEQPQSNTDQTPQ